MKLIKKTIKLLLWIAGIVVALVLALPLWIGPVVKTTAGLVVPKKTGTAFNLGAFALNPYTGKLAVGDVQLFNPAGFDQKMAVTLGAFNVEVDMASLAGGPIVVKDIMLKDVFVSYVMNARGENNFAIIKKNAMGEEEGKREKGIGKREEGKQTAQTPQTAQTSQTSTKVIIDRLLIQNVAVQFGPITIPQPISMELRDIGRKSNGVTMQEAWEQIYAQVLKNFNSLGVNLEGLVGLEGAELQNAVKAIGAAGDLSTKEGRKKAVLNLVDAFVGGAAAAGGAASQTKDAVGKGAGQAAEAAGDGTKKTVDAVGEEAGKAVNALKGLFK